MFGNHRWFLLWILHLFFALIVSGCGTDDEEKEEDRDLAIERANIYLTDGNCEDAIKVIESVGNWPFHTIYLQTKAAAYACRAGFSELVFWADDLDKISSGSTSLIGSLTKMTTSPMVSSGDQKYSDLLTAINVLLYSGNATSPSSAARLSVFSASEVSDMNFQLLMMILAQLGKFAFYYGNANPTAGVKGTGASGNGNSNGNVNTCFINYADATSIAAISLGLTGSCTNLANIGHNDMVNSNIPITDRSKRACQGIVLFNNLIDVLANVVVTSDETLNELTSTFVTAFNAACSTLNNPGVCLVKSQTECETDYTYTNVIVQRYYAIMFEPFFL